MGGRGVKFMPHPVRPILKNVIRREGITVEGITLSPSHACSFKSYVLTPDNDNNGLLPSAYSANNSILAKINHSPK